MAKAIHTKANDHAPVAVDHPTSTWLVLLLAGTVAAVTALLKVEALSLWRFMSDLFTFDQGLGEAVNGHWGREYTYGNLFAIHGYISLWLLVPFKALLGPRAVYLWVVIAPLAYVLYVVVLWRTVTDAVRCERVRLAILTLVALPPYVCHGVFEAIYGFHPDTIGGFLLAAYAARRMWMDRLHAGQTNGDPVAMLLLLVFLGLKEEMALIGIVFFAVCLMMRRRRVDGVGLSLSVLWLLGQVVIMRVMHTPFTNASTTVKDILPALQLMPAQAVAALASTDFKGLAVWAPMVMILILFVVVIRLHRQVTVIPLALLLAGLVKHAFGFAVNDGDPTTWHHFAGVCMLVAALALQLSTSPQLWRHSLAGFPGTLAALSLVFFITTGTYWGFKNAASNRQAKTDIPVQRTDLLAIKGLVAPRAIVAIPQRTAVEWCDGQRYTLFPRGLTGTPRWLADQAVIERSDHPCVEPVDTKLGPGTRVGELVFPGFTETARNSHFILISRTGASPRNRALSCLRIDHSP